ncbi:BTAD domain-containing putative transcriptional regulator [Nonomuraea sp. MCN248]|uniref:BTAD domain-containing putative transcriptional regulator n=1 Tax=Nonomuraea corallina TaxID=2989783 RepID=A0ABT4SKD0_9ACTN|nr:BTAD domain-containing putative transcriptional regulator [Nonomuraea corallina]MDA0637657.1 BTAD domain-containing putative transcriptional regulator [Nonomuraea corallina]
MRFCLLGPPEVRGDACHLWFRGHRQRAVFAALALNANRVVETDRLVDIVWGDRPPPTAQAQIQKSLSALRRTLGRTPTGGERISTVCTGYLLHADPEEIDVEVFRREVRQASSAMVAGDLPTAVTCFRRALARWFGRALDGVPGLAAEAAHLEEERLIAWEECMHAELALDGHARVAAEIEPLVGRHPLRERLCALLMIALYGCGRRVEALRAYHGMRGRLREELGIEPSSALRDIEHAILMETPAAEMLPVP